MAVKSIDECAGKGAHVSPSVAAESIASESARAAIEALACIDTNFSPRDAARLADLLENSPPPNAALQRARQRHEQFVVSNDADGVDARSLAT